MKTMIVVAAFGPVLLWGAPCAQAADRAKLFVNGALQAGSLDFTQQRTFTEFAEEGRLDNRYAVKSGLGGEFGFQWRFGRRLGVMASVSLFKREDTGSFSALLPHPLYLNHERRAAGSRADLSHRETAGHVSLVYIRETNSLELSLFGGPSLISVKTDFLDRVVYSHTYPYDNVTVRGVDTASADDSAFGFNVGGGLDYRLNRRFGLGAQVRFSKATVNLIASDGREIHVDAGGLQAAAGFRIFF